MAIDERIPLAKLKVLALVVELGSVTQAADRLYVAQPVVTAHLRSLEERVGAKLVYREGRGVHLTEAGRAVHAWAVDILRRTEELSRHLDGLTDGNSGSVVVGASMTIGSYSLPAILAAFRLDRPQVQVRMNILDPDHVIPETESGKNDFAVVLVRADPSSPGLTAERIGTEEFVLVAGRESGPSGPIVTAEELGGVWFVEAQAGSQRRRHADTALARAGISSREVAIEFGHPEAMKRAVMSGLGVSLMYRSSVSAELDAGALREIQIEGVDRLEIPVFLLHRKDKLFSTAQRDLIDAIRAAFVGAPSPSPARVA